MIVQLTLLIGVILLAYFLFKTIKNISMLVVNSIIGIFALIGFNTLSGAGVAVNFWTVAITVIGGIFGFIFVVAAHYLGFAF